MAFIRPTLLFALCIPAALAAGMAIRPGAALAQATAPADPAQAGEDVIRLPDAERQAIIDRQTPDSAAAARGEMVASERAALGIGGEIGAAIGSNGMRGAYGTAAIPLGAHGGAVVSFESSRYGARR